MIEEVYSINNFNSYGYDYWTEIIQLGYIIYRDPLDKINILNSKTFDRINEIRIEETDSFNLKVIENRIYFSINNKVFIYDKDSNEIKEIYKSELEGATILSGGYFYGRTFKRKPRVCKDEIVDGRTLKKIFSSEEQNYLIHFYYPFCIFQERHSGTYFLFDLSKEINKWKTKIDDGIPGRRFYHFRENDFIIQKRIQENTYTTWANVQKRDIQTGFLEWELKRCLENYNILPNKEEYLGIGGTRIHHFGSDGAVLHDSRLTENLSTSSHLASITGKNLLFSTHLDNNIPVIGILDIETYKLKDLFEVFVAEHKSSREGLDKPFMFDNKIYVRDSQDKFRILYPPKQVHLA